MVDSSKGSAKICPNGMVKYYDANGVFIRTGFYHARHLPAMRRDWNVTFA